MNILVCGMRDSGKTDLCKAYCYAEFDESEVEHEVKELGNKTIYTIEYLVKTSQGSASLYRDGHTFPVTSNI